MSKFAVFDWTGNFAGWCEAESPSKAIEPFFGKKLWVTCTEGDDFDVFVEKLVCNPPPRRKYQSPEEYALTLPTCEVDRLYYRDCA